MLSPFSAFPTTAINPLPLESETRSLFYELGTVAVNNLLGYEALQLFTELRTAEPDAGYPIVGLGLTAMLCGDFADAEGQFSHPTLAASTLAPYAQALLAICYKMQGNNSGFDAASKAAKESSDPGIATSMDELVSVNIDMQKN